MIKPDILAVLAVVSACHGTQRERLAPPSAPAGIAAFFRDTAVATVSPADRRTFELPTPGQRDSLHATLKRERQLWQAGGLSAYRFLLRSECFCPGGRGWLLLEVRSGQALRAWNQLGKAVPLTDWDTFTVDGLFDNLERSADRDRVVQVAFDPRWHFPAFAHTIARIEPDAWGTFEVRGLRPL